MFDCFPQYLSEVLIVSQPVRNEGSGSGQNHRFVIAAADACMLPYDLPPFTTIKKALWQSHRAEDAQYNLVAAVHRFHRIQFALLLRQVAILNKARRKCLQTSQVDCLLARISRLAQAKCYLHPPH